MSMSTGSSGKQTADMNVTPLIDVLLVLLIIFMVITPLTPKGLEVLVPQPPKTNTPPPPNDRTVVVQILGDGSKASTIKINQDDVTLESLEGRLTDIFKIRAEKIMFVRADPDIPFEQVAQVIAIANSAGVDKVGLVTKNIEAGH